MNETTKTSFLPEFDSTAHAHAVANKHAADAKERDERHAWLRDAWAAKYPGVEFPGELASKDKM